MTAYLLNLARRGAGRLHAVGQEHPRRAAAPAQPQRHDDAITRCGPATSSAASAEPDVSATACMTNCDGRAQGRVDAAGFRAQRARQPRASRTAWSGRSAASTPAAPAPPGQRRKAARPSPPPHRSRVPAANPQGAARTRRPGRPGADAEEQLHSPATRSTARWSGRAGPTSRRSTRARPTTSPARSAPAARACGARSRCRRRRSTR